MKASDWDLKKAIGHKGKSYELDLTKKDLILYALGIGFQEDPLNKGHYNFSYENAEEFQSFPTIPVVIAHKNFDLIRGPGIPDFNPMMVLHGEEAIEMFKPIE